MMKMMENDHKIRWSYDARFLRFDAKKSEKTWSYDARLPEFPLPKSADMKRDYPSLPVLPDWLV